MAFQIQRLDADLRHRGYVVWIPGKMELFTSAAELGVVLCRGSPSDAADNAYLFHPADRATASLNVLKNNSRSGRTRATDQPALMPPSTTRLCPVTKRDASLAKNRAACAISSTRPT